MPQLNTGIRAIGLAAVTVLLLAVCAGPARAGQWIQVSCTNPDGSTAPSQGWVSSSSANIPSGSTGSASCSASTPMFGSLIANPTPSGASETLTYTPPSGSTLSGGTLAVLLDGDGGGASGAATVYSPALSYPNDVVAQCVESGGPPCGGGASNYSGSVTLPSNAGGGVYVQATCAALPSGESCTPGGPLNDVARVEVHSAQLTLTNNSTVGGSGFTGSATGPSLSGTAQLLFTATDQSGPGVYSVTATLDGTTVYSGVPNNNGGDCVPVGSSGATMMFDYQQPCLQSEIVDIPIPTSGVADGTHSLSVSVTDAAGNSATVYAENVTVANNATSVGTTNPTPAPSPTPGPKHTLRRAGVHFQFTWKHRHPKLTTARTAVVTHLPTRARIALACTGPGCPPIRIAAFTGAQHAALIHELLHLTFHRGDVLKLTVTEPGRRAEVITLRFRVQRKPIAREAK